MTHKKYRIAIIQREGGWEIGPDWHATVTRIKDGYKVIYIGDWLWLLRFKRQDRYHAKLKKVQNFCV